MYNVLVPRASFPETVCSSAHLFSIATKKSPKETKVYAPSRANSDAETPLSIENPVPAPDLQTSDLGSGPGRKAFRGPRPRGGTDEGLRPGLPRSHALRRPGSCALPRPPDPARHRQHSGVCRAQRLWGCGERGSHQAERRRPQQRRAIEVLKGNGNELEMSPLADPGPRATPGRPLNHAAAQAEAPGQQGERAEGETWNRSPASRARVHPVSSLPSALPMTPQALKEVGLVPLTCSCPLPQGHTPGGRRRRSAEAEDGALGLECLSSEASALTRDNVEDQGGQGLTAIRIRKRSQAQTWAWASATAALSGTASVTVQEKQKHLLSVEARNKLHASIYLLKSSAFHRSIYYIPLFQRAHGAKLSDKHLVANTSSCSLYSW